MAEREAATGPGADGGLAGEVALASSDEGGPESLLIVLGLVLALTGGGLLVLGWLARRSRDPLLP